jgi:hypothetical protein
MGRESCILLHIIYSSIYPGASLYSIQVKANLSEFGLHMKKQKPKTHKTDRAVTTLHCLWRLAVPDEKEQLLLLPSYW